MWGLVPVFAVFALWLSYGVNVRAFHSSTQCVQVGQANYDYEMAKIFTGGEFPYKVPWVYPGIYGYLTIGGRLMGLEIMFLDESFSQSSPPFIQENPANANPKICPYKRGDRVPYQYVDLCPGDKVEIKTYAVEQDSVIMTGWLHVEIQLTDTDDEILAVYIQMRDEYFNAIGEFLTTEDESCDPVTPGLIAPTKFQVLPCSAVGYREAKISSAVLMAQPMYYTNKELEKNGYLPKENLTRGVHFTWRLSEYWCNRHYMIRPEATIFTRKGLAVPRGNQQILRKAAEYWITPEWFGAADIKLPHTKLTCNRELIDYKTGKMLPDPATGEQLGTWIKKTSELSTIDNDYFADKQMYIQTCSIPGQGGTQTDCSVARSCQADTWTTPIGKTQHEVVPTFSGRCTHHFEKTPSHDALQGCNLDSTGQEFQGIPDMEAYSDYVENLTINRINMCNTTCMPPKTKQDLEKIKKFDAVVFSQNVTRTILENTASRLQTKRSILWQAYKYHAILCTVWTIFLIPLSIFAARYYKETFMTFSCVGIHVWYWIHIGCLVMSIALFGSSYASMFQNVRVWGNIVDKNHTFPHASTHRVLGWSSVTIYLLMAFLGGLRGGRDISQLKIRLTLMTLHSVVGFTQYFLNLFAILNSSFVPASPTMLECADDKLFENALSPVSIMTCIWILVDLAFHSVLTFLQFHADKTRGIRRGWYCPIIPIMPSDSDKDMKGSGVRKILFLTYAAVAFIFTLVIFVMIVQADLKEDCEFTTTCQVNYPQYKYGCSALAIRFAEHEMSEMNKAKKNA